MGNRLLEMSKEECDGISTPCHRVVIRIIKIVV